MAGPILAGPGLFLADRVHSPELAQENRAKQGQ